MYWEERPDAQNWLEQIRYFTDFKNELTANELRDAFIHLANLYVTDFGNLKLLEDFITERFGERAVFDIIDKTETGKELTEIDKLSSQFDPCDILGATLDMCEYIEEKWF